MSFLTKHFLRFGEFTVDTDQKVLLRDGAPVALTPKVFDTLLVLIENSGRIIEKNELMNRLWPDSFVEEANLAYNIQQLRKSLGDNARQPAYIETVARRGYRFIARLEDVLTDGEQSGSNGTERYSVYEAKAPQDVPVPGIERPARDRSPAAESAKRPVVNATTASRFWRPADSTAFAVALLALLTGVIFLYERSLARSNKGLTTTAKTSAGRLVMPFAVEKLTASGESTNVAISHDGRYIAYTIGGTTTTQSIWLRQLSTNTNMELARSAGVIYSLTFAGNGEYLYFVKGDPKALYRLALVGGVPTRILDNLEGNFSLSADDSQVAFVREAINHDGQREYSLMIAGSDGAGERALLVGTHPNRLDAPLWSPDSQSILCARGNPWSGSQSVCILEVNVADGTQREISPHKFYRIKKMAWLPDKSGLIISGAKTYAVELWRLSFQDMELRQAAESPASYFDLGITDDGSQAVASQATRVSDLWVGTNRDLQTLKKTTQAIDGFCWTPDGRLVYQSSAAGTSDLWITHPNGSGQKQLTVNAGANAAPSIAPEGRYIAFTSNRTGAFQIWRTNLDGSDQVQLTYGSGATFPAISADGKWVLYN